MKKKILFMIVWCSFIFVNAGAQVPEGYVKASVIMADQTILQGFLQDNLKKKASVTFINEKGERKKVFYGTDVNGIIIDSVEYTAIKGDFFRILCRGKMSFLQKASHAAGKMIYNGSEAFAIPGTNGKIGDYFLYKDNQLTLINKNSLEGLVATQFSGSDAATEKAKAINGNIPALADAVVLYNNLHQ